MADAGILGSEESRSQTFLWPEQDSVSGGIPESLVGGVLSPLALLRSGFLSWNHGPMRRGGRRTAPELGTVTAPPEEVAQGPGACLASPIVEGKGIAQGQLFTVKGSPFLAGPDSPHPCSGRRTSLRWSLAGPERPRG